MNDREELAALLGEAEKAAWGEELPDIRKQREFVADFLAAYGVAVQRWNPAAEPPDTTRAVIVRRRNGKVEQGTYLGVNGWWKIYGTRTKSITHWTEMPKFPELQKGEEDETLGRI